MEKKKEKREKKGATPIEKKSVLTTFVLLFPSMLIAIIATVNSSVFIAGLAIALFCYQAILLKSFVDDHYALR